MGEIKSTLDLIMEKTRNLNLSEEEKKAFRDQEIAGKVKGLVQRHLDGSITEERLRQEVSALQMESGSATTVKRLFRADVLGRIVLEQDCTALLAMLETGIGEDPSYAKEIVQEHQEKAERLRESQEESLLKKFSMREISGTSVAPNLEADPEWRKRFQSLEDDMKARLKAITERLP